METDAKKWWASLTHWVNGAGIFLIGIADPLAQALPSMQAYIGPGIYKWAFLALGVGNILIRQFKTSKPIG
jgi:hypothetical protein